MYKRSHLKIIIALIFIICASLTFPYIIEAETSDILKGIAKHNSVSVYNNTDNDRIAIKNYTKGSILYFKNYNEEWYIAEVFKDGQLTMGFISSDDIELLNLTNQKNLIGLSNNKVNIYSKLNSSSTVLKTYRTGHILHYRSYSDEWYQATIYINNQATTGYINKNDVETLDLTSQTLKKGLTISRTTVFTQPNQLSSNLKSYNKGHILTYKSFSDNWFEATVIINDKHHTGYINKNEVETLYQEPQILLNGIAIDKTFVFSKPSSDSSSLKSYKSGHILWYKTFSDNWYEATVFLDDQSYTGYIKKDSVDALSDSNVSLKGYALRHTNIYHQPTRSSNIIKSYPEGHLLSYEDFSGNWYRAKVYLNNRLITGYLLKQDTRDQHKTSDIISQYALNPETAVYSELSAVSNPIKTYRYGKKLLVRPFTDSWYSAEVYKNNRLTKGYIKKSDTTSQLPTSKNIVNPNQVYTYSQMKSDIIKLKEQYPHLITIKSVGTSLNGRDIPLVKLGIGDTKITINGSHHAREWITTNLIMEQIDYYSSAYVNRTFLNGLDIRELLNNVSIYFVPMVNPDGVLLNQHGPAQFSNAQQLLSINNNDNDFSSWKANSRGVDLNRQYPAGWNRITNNSIGPSSENYKGSAPLTEPESRAMYNFAKKHDFKTHVSYHSTGEVIYWSYNATGSLLRTSENIAKLISDETGYGLMYNSYIYSNGGYTDWVIDSLKKPGFTIEISPFVANKPTPLSNFTRIWNQNKAIPAILMNEAHINRFNR
ncbi:M14 family metallocarboxypeptidase [Halolactibacillus miurensis]|uniref:M14 family metallocarboxypeptidase n=1 Tax=Halolactibacillus miurensis TaxID=306541 RepID=UPI00116088F1|nr:M14 family metallocarboxypeptidase [Halolactibacillus miurensis]